MMFSGANFLVLVLQAVFQLLIPFSSCRDLPSSVAPEPWYGDFIGSFSDPQGIGIRGDVYVVNSSCIQVMKFTYGAQAPDLFFWLDSSPEPSSSGVKIRTFEFGNSPLKEYNNSRVVLSFPDLKIKDYKSFGLYCRAFSKAFGSVRIPVALTPPKAEFLEGNVVATKSGERYNVMSGPVLVIDRRTIKIYGFHFNGRRAPDGYFFVGQGLQPKRKDDGIKVGIRGKDTPDLITSMSEEYTGNRDMILELSESHDIYNIDWISVYCYRFGVDFGHIRIQTLSSRIPPYVPSQKRYDEVEKPAHEPWPIITLLGNERRTNFTFQLGPPGAERGYKAITASKPNDYVWYVNGYMAAEIWLQRGRTYNFVVEGGRDETKEHFYNPLYISNDPFGGYARLAEYDRKQVQVFAGLQNGVPVNNSVGRLCLWSPTVEEENPDDYEDIPEFRKSLQLKCEPGIPGLFQWTPDKDTPNVVYYQSFSAYRMGWKIVVTDMIPIDLPDFKEEPYRNDLWIDNNLVTEIPPHRPQQRRSEASTASFSRLKSASIFSVIFAIFMSCLFSIAS